MIPELSEFGPSEILVELHGDFDNLGRIQFSAFWPDPQKPNGVAGQVFRTNFDDFKAREADQGRIVRIWGAR